MKEYKEAEKQAEKIKSLRTSVSWSVFLVRII